MKMQREQAQEEIFKALLAHDGNRAKASKDLGMSLRTFYRHLDEFEMHPILDKCGWQKNPGPPRGARGHGSVIRTLVVRHIAAGKVEYGQLAMEIYGQDSPTTRQRLYSLLDEIKKTGRIRLDEATGNWELT